MQAGQQCVHSVLGEIDPAFACAVGNHLGAQRCIHIRQQARLGDLRPLLDVDGNGRTDALTDGILLIRYLFGLRGAALVSDAIGVGSTRTTAQAIEAYLGTVFP